MECANCGRQNQSTTRFCAECGDVLRADPPRPRRSQSKRRSRKLRRRIHWVRIPPRAAPSILTARLEPSRSTPDGVTPDRMMRRVDLVLAALVGIAGVIAYVAYPYLKGDSAGAATSAVAAAPTLAPLPPISLAPLVSTPATPLEPPPAPSALSSAASSRLDVVPPRTLPRAKSEPSARRSAERVEPPVSHPSYAVTTAYTDPFAVAPPASPARVAAAPPVRKDRLQQMNDTIAGCAHEGFLARVACEQRALLAYCDGQWGHNDRCPAGRTADYGN